MSAVGASHFAGVILAGGASTRMGRDKVLVELAGRPLLAHVIERLAPQVAALALSVHEDDGRYAAFGLPTICDREAARNGPLAGVLAGLEFAKTGGYDFLVVTPCDAPFLPLDLVARLASAAGPDRIAVAAGESGVEPLFSLWPVRLKELVAGRFAAGESSPARIVAAVGRALVRFPAARPDPFSNMNSPGDLERARASSLAGR